MRLFGAKVGRTAQAYRRPPGRPSMLTTFRGPTTTDYETLGYPQAYEAPIVYACVSRISRVISQLPRKIRRVSDNEMLPVPFWVEQPNSYQGGNDFIKALCASLLLWGEAFVIPFRNERGLTIEAAVVNPQYVWHSVQGQSVRWSINGVFYDGEMIHLRNDALPGKVRGFAAANTMRNLTATNAVAQDFIYRVVEQGGAYQLAILFPEDIDDETIDDTVKQVLARHSGPDNAYKPLLLAGGAQVVPINQSNADSQFLDLTDQTAKQIATMWFGLDETLLGLKSDQPQVYQNNAAVWYRFWMLACKHIAGEIERALTLLLPRGQRYDLEEWEVLMGGPHDRAKLAREMAAVNTQMKAKIFTEDELRRVTGMYPLPEYEPLTSSAPAVTDDDEEDAMIEEPDEGPAADFGEEKEDE